MKTKRKICFITGTRSDYGLMRNVLKKINKEFDLSLIVVGMHLAKEYGETVKEIKKDGFKIAKEIRTLSGEDTGAAMAKAIGIGIIETTKVLQKLKPDLFLILGDRDEAMAGALAAVHLNIPIVHIHGGDQGDNSGHTDDSTRHAVTKFAHLHLAATKLSAERIKKLGEEEWRIKVTGSPALDEILSEKLYDKKYLEKKYSLDLNKILILALQHASPNQITAAEEQIKETMEALKEINEQTILIYPNSDAGSRRMIKVINEYKLEPFLKIYKNLPRKDYLSLMKYAKVFVGNSSSGTIDTPSFKLPVVNIGTRESVREHAGNKIYVGHDKKAIVKAIKKSLFDKKYIAKVKRCKGPYGDGRAGERIVAILKKIKIDERLLTKKLAY